MRAAGGRSNSGKVISISEAGATKRQKIEKWLRKEMVEQYGNDDAIDNPLIRICIMFDSLSCEAQYELFGYAKRCIFGFRQDMNLRDRFWYILEKGGIQDGSWNDVEEFASQLICKENIYKNSVVACRKGNKGGLAVMEKAYGD